MIEKLKEYIKKIKESKTKSLIAGIILFVFILGGSYALFMVMQESGEKELSFGNLDITYVDGQTVSAAGQLPLTEDEVEDYASKTDFTVKNTGSIPVYLEISLTNITIANELKSNDFKYALYKGDSKIASGTFENCGTELVLKNDILQYVTDNTVTYTIALWIQDNGGNQNAMLNKNMSAKIKVVATDKKAEMLPSNYQEVEYIESTGTQYIDTGVIPNQDTKSYFDCQYIISESSTSNYKFIAGVRTDVNVNAYIFPVEKATGRLKYEYSTSTNTAVTNPITERSIINADKNVITVNSSSQTVSEQKFSCDYSMYIFDANLAGSPSNRGTLLKLYSLKIYEDNTLLRNYVPCYRKSDNTIGLYDLVENKFYSNNGTGAFLKGNDI